MWPGVAARGGDDPATCGVEGDAMSDDCRGSGSGVPAAFGVVAVCAGLAAAVAAAPAQAAPRPQPAPAAAGAARLAPTARGATPARERVLAAAAELMRAARLCALVTLDAHGAPQARAMDPFPPEPDLSVWLATNPKTRKLGEIRRDPRVVLFYLDPDGQGYVTLHGTARVVDDAAEKARRFKPEWKAFYSDENRGADYLLIEVHPTRVEVVSARHGIAAEPQAWAPAVVTFP
jgi:PPOX class probable F420-dependent enzyme